ncbi:MAG: antibiotic biosynthesis monooxygenase [Hyphomonas sp.]
MLIVIGHVITTPDTAERITQLCIEHSARSRSELGCIAHNVHVDCEDASRLVFVEHWADMDALKAHFAVPESNDFVREIRALSPAPTAMKIYAAEEVRPGR